MSLLATIGVLTVLAVSGWFGTRLDRWLRRRDMDRALAHWAACEQVEQCTADGEW